MPLHAAVYSAKTCPAIFESGRFAADSSLAYVYAHFLLQHPPYVAGRPLSYYGNLMFAGSLFGAIRHSMEGSGTWDRTTVIITSDHGLRRSLLRTPELTHLEDELLGTVRARIPNVGATHVPFLIKFGGNGNHLTYDRPFDTVLLAELTLKLLRQELSTAKEVAAWIDAQRQALPNAVDPAKGPQTEMAATAQP